jgi:outer membrane biosynthesis protein TonB
MIPQSQPKKPKNSSKANLVISAIFHALLIGVVFYFAARSGILGEKIKSITVTKEEKPKEKPKEPEKKPEPPKEIPKVETPKLTETPKAAAPPAAVAPTVVPAAAEAPTLEFTDGAKLVNEQSDPVQLYKGYLESTLRLKWNRPENMADDNFVAEVVVNVDKQGNLSSPKWLKGSGDALWDQSVKNVFKVVKNIDRSPPTNFPPDVIIRFDVQEETEPVLQ